MTYFGKCVLCESSSLKVRKGKIWTKQKITANKVLECHECEFVFLNDFSHISDNHYEESLMLESRDEKVDLKIWRRETEDDDLRRFLFLKDKLQDSEVLEVGFGNAGFLKMCKPIVRAIEGIEPSRQFQEIFKSENLDIFNSINQVKRKYDNVVSFHVIEHVKDPYEFLKELLNATKIGGVIYIETPNANDALLKLYESVGFQNYTYWDNHLGLFSHKSLTYLLNKFQGISFDFLACQRYGIANHLHWLSKNLPGGHKNWAFLDSIELNLEYSRLLNNQKLNDTLFVSIQRNY